MSDADNSPLANFGKFVPGFDFLQNLATQAAGSAAQKGPQIPNLGSWVAPTLNVEELDKRIQELKVVQFWLDQNATALKATIQALEVQKMTLATLKGMNFNMGDVANAFQLKVAGGMQSGTEKARSFSGLEIPPTSFGMDKAAESPPPKPPVKAKPEKAVVPAAAGVVDPMQWWGALTQQFQNIATEAVKDAAKKAAINTTTTTKNVAKGMSKDAIKSATGMATGSVENMAETASKTMLDGARAAMNSALRSSQAWPSPVAAKKPAAKKTAVKTTRKTNR